MLLYIIWINQNGRIGEWMSEQKNIKIMYHFKIEFFLKQIEKWQHRGIRTYEYLTEEIKKKFNFKTFSHDRDGCVPEKLWQVPITTNQNSFDHNACDHRAFRCRICNQRDSFQEYYNKKKRKKTIIKIRRKINRKIYKMLCGVN